MNYVLNLVATPQLGSVATFAFLLIAISSLIRFNPVQINLVIFLKGTNHQNFISAHCCPTADVMKGASFTLTGHFVRLTILQVPGTWSSGRWVHVYKRCTSAAVLGFDRYSPADLGFNQSASSECVLTGCLISFIHRQRQIVNRCTWQE